MLFNIVLGEPSFPDPRLWREVYSGSASINYAVYAAGKYVVVGDYGTVLVSNDGKTWNKAYTGISEDLLCVCYGPSGFVATGKNGRIMHSPDGTTWNTVPGGSGLLALCSYGNGYYVAIRNDSGTYLKSFYSSNGLSFSAVESDGQSNLGSLDYVAIAYGRWYIKNNGTSDRFILAGNTSGYGYFPANAAAMPRGGWNRDTDIRAATAFSDAVYANGKIVAVGNQYGAMSSGDSIETFYVDANRIMFDGSRFYATNGGRIWTSQNGTSWTDLGVKFQTSGTSRIVCSAERYIAACSDGRIYISNKIIH